MRFMMMVIPKGYESVSKDTATLGRQQTILQSAMEILRNN